MSKINPKEFNKEAAKNVLKLFSIELKKLQIRARSGDHSASLKLIKTLTNRDWTLRQLGFEVGETGKLKKWKKPSKRDQLLNKLALSGKPEDAMKVLEMMSGK